MSSNAWETVWRQGDKAIERWIDGQMKGKSCVVVLVGSKTASRPWVRHEIIKGWNDGKGVLGIHIHNLKDSSGNKSTKGLNPFGSIEMSGGSRMSAHVNTYDPPYSNSTDVYNYIANNIEAWTESAAQARGR